MRLCVAAALQGLRGGQRGSEMEGGESARGAQPLVSHRTRSSTQHGRQQ
jgi:hypothetical protein